MFELDDRKPRSIEEAYIELDVMCGKHCDCGRMLTHPELEDRVPTEFHTHDCNYVAVLKTLKGKGGCIRR